jgi:hypothetical protein
MDEASGVRYDAAGSEDLSEVNTVGSVSGKHDHAARFVGANSESLDASGGLGLGTGAWTVSGWVQSRPDAPTGSEVVLRTGEAVPPFRYEATVYRGAFSHAWWVASGDASAAAAHVPVDGEWFFLCAWFDPSDQKVRISVNDGTPAVSSARTLTSTTATYTQLGVSVGASVHDLDMVAVHNRVLSAGERTQLFNSGKGYHMNSFALSEYNTVGYTTGKKDSAAQMVKANLEKLENATFTDALDASLGLTVNFWIKLGAAGTANYFELGGDIYQGRNILGLNDQGSSRGLVFVVVEAGDFAPKLANHSTNINDGSWHMITAWYDPSDFTAHLMIDNAGEVATAALAAQLDFSANDPAGKVLGISPDTVYSNDAYDEVLIANRLFSYDEITGLYNAGAGRFYDFNTL